ncbi:MAG: class I SAM-dependent methyltransferase [Caulobacteraceae bacterium]
MSCYFDLVRREIRPLLPAAASRIVDVGCGIGGTAKWLKEIYPSAHVIGIEGNGDLRAALSENVDESYIHDLNDEPPDMGQPDLILFLDVLEHLVDPETVLSRFVSRLAVGGSVIISLPNVAHLSVALPLAVSGRWTYADAGILDRTHLRFFVQRTAIELAESCGLNVEAALYAGMQGPKSRLIDRATLGLIRDRLAKQFIMRAVREPVGHAKWAPAAEY